ncbi:MAG: hypothetical protein RLZZ21_2368, partial [Planctomycetota bacterium]
MGVFSKKNPCPRVAGRAGEEESKRLIDLVMSDLMFRREFLDHYESAPLWAKTVFRVRLWWSDLFRAGIVAGNC